MTAIIDGFNTTNIDVSDLTYQASKHHLPDKTPLWAEIPVEKDGWVLAHDAIRFEIKEFKRAIAAVSATGLEPWQVDAVKSWINGHLVHVHEHHHNEDDIFNPFLRQRVNYPDKLEADHVTLVELMDEIKDTANKLTAGNTLDALGALWLRYETLMLPHLHEEEVVGLPLARAYFTPQEIGKVVSSFVKNGDPIALGSFVHAMGRKKDAQAFMAREGIPKFVWYIPGKGFKALRTLYRKKMQTHIDSLVAGRIVSSVRTPKSAKGLVTANAANNENVVAQAVSPQKQVKVQVLGAH